MSKKDSKKKSGLKSQAQSSGVAAKVPAHVEKAISNYLIKSNDRKKEVATVAAYIDKDVAHLNAVCSSLGSPEPIFVFAALCLASEVVDKLLNNRYRKSFSLVEKCLLLSRIQTVPLEFAIKAYSANAQNFLNDEQLTLALHHYNLIVRSLFGSILDDVKSLPKEQQADVFSGVRTNHIGVSFAIGMACLFGCSEATELLLSLDSSFLHYVFKGAISAGEQGARYIYSLTRQIVANHSAVAIRLTYIELKKFREKERLEARKKLMAQVVKLSQGTQISNENLFTIYLQIKEVNDADLKKLIGNLFKVKERLIFFLEEIFRPKEEKLDSFIYGLNLGLRLGESVFRNLLQDFLIVSIERCFSDQFVNMFFIACIGHPEFRKIINNEFIEFFLHSAVTNREILLFKEILKLGEKFIAFEEWQKILEELLLLTIEKHEPIEFIKALLADAKTDPNGSRCRRVAYNSLSKEFEGQYHFPPLIWATTHYNLPAAKLLLDYKVDIECIFRPEKAVHVIQEEEGVCKPGVIFHGATPLITAVKMNYLDLVELYHQCGADINFRNHNGSSALFLAAQLGLIEIVRYLLKANANIYLRNEIYGINARQIAIARKHFEVANLLLAVELKNWIIDNLDLSQDPIPNETNQKIACLVNCLVDLKAQVLDGKIYILAEHFKNVAPNPKKIQILKIEKAHLEKIFNKLTVNHADLPLFIWNVLTSSVTEANAAVNAQEQRVQFLEKINDYEVNARNVISELKSLEAHLLAHTPTRIPQRWKLTTEERERADRLIRKIEGLRPIDNKDDNAFLQQRLTHFELYYPTLVSLKKLFAKKVENITHAKDRKISASQIKTEKILGKKVNEPQKATLVIPDAKAELVPVSAKTVVKAEPSRKPQRTQPTPSSVPQTQSYRVPYQPKPRLRTFKMVSQLFAKLRCHARDYQLLDEIVALNLKSDDWQVWMTINNALLGLCARIADRKGLQRERNALFHHHDLLPIPGNHNLKYYQTLNARLVTLANDLLHDSTQSELLASIKAKPIPAETLATCIAQLHHGREEMRAYQGVDFDLLSPEILLAARGFTAARFSTYVMPLIRAKRLGEFEKSSEYRQICRLVDEAKPYITVGGDFRHGKSLDLLLMPPPKNAGDDVKDLTVSQAADGAQIAARPAVAAETAAAGTFPSARELALEKGR